MALSDLFSRRRGEPEETAAAEAAAFPTKALAKFLSSLQSHEQPVILDLGPVVGSNVSFFGEHLGCKIFVEDVYKDLDRHIRDGRLEAMPGFLATRFPQAEGSIDGILAWDVFDYLDRASGQELARQLVRILKPHGALLAFFAASAVVEGKPADPTYTRYIVSDPATLQHRTYPAAQPKGKPLQNRDVQRMFEPLRITEQFLLKHNVREVLFRKAATAGTPTPPDTGA